MIPVGLLVRTDPDAGRVPPGERPLGRAAVRLAEEGILVVFGDDLRAGRLSGWAVRRGGDSEGRSSDGWMRVERVPVVALHDRFPSQTWPDAHARLVAEAEGIPLGNPASVTGMLRDKLATQTFLETAGFEMPAVEADPEQFSARLAAWGTAFLKPRYGALGRGIRRVVPGDALPAWGEGAVPGILEPLFLQQAVRPPDGWAGWSARALVQREPDGAWVRVTCALRRSRTDPVVNVARGAEVVDAGSVLEGSVLDAVDRLALAVARAVEAHPEGRWVVELGVDLVIDAVGRPWPIEVNSRPRGRLEALAQADPSKYRDAHVEACARPLRYLARNGWGVANGSPAVDPP